MAARDKGRSRALREAQGGLLKARYSKHYRISEGELAWLGDRVEALGRLVQVVCEEHIAALERSVAA
jgi:hypothetical protein